MNKTDRFRVVEVYGNFLKKLSTPDKDKSGSPRKVTKRCIGSSENGDSSPAKRLKSNGGPFDTNG